MNMLCSTIILRTYNSALMIDDHYLLCMCYNPNHHITCAQSSCTKLPGSRARSKSHFYINITSLSSDSSSPPPSSHDSSVPSPSSHYLEQAGGEVGKPKGNTLLHLFGGWLFAAAIWPRTLTCACRYGFICLEGGGTQGFPHP